MKKLLFNSKIFLKRNSSTILTFVGAAGVLATAVSAVKAGTKVQKVIEANEVLKGEKLTKIETVRCTFPVFVPTIAIGASTIMCIFGANVLNKRHQAALTSAYAFLDSSYREYKKSVNETFGDDADRKIAQTIANNRYEELEPAKAENSEHLFMDSYSNRFFYSTRENLKNAEEAINGLISSRGFVYLNEYYELLGLNHVNIEEFEVGWSKDSLNRCGYDRIVFEYEPVTTDDGDEFYVITLPFFPFTDYLF